MKMQRQILFFFIIVIYISIYPLSADENESITVTSFSFSDAKQLSDVPDEFPMYDDSANFTPLKSNTTKKKSLILQKIAAMDSKEILGQITAMDGENLRTSSKSDAEVLYELYLSSPDQECMFC